MNLPVRVRASRQKTKILLLCSFIWAATKGTIWVFQFQIMWPKKTLKRVLSGLHFSCFQLHSSWQARLAVTSYFPQHEYSSLYAPFNRHPAVLYCAIPLCLSYAATKGVSGPGSNPMLVVWPYAVRPPPLSLFFFWMLLFISVKNLFCSFFFFFLFLN